MTQKLPLSIALITFLTLFFNSNRIVENNPVKTAERFAIEKSENNGFARLFNGKDLSGWGYLINQDGNVTFQGYDGIIQTNDKRFQVKDGILITNPNSYTKVNDEDYINLWTAREYPENFHLTLEFRASKKADSGIFLRGVQLQCRDYLLAGPYKTLKNYKPQEWNKVEVVVKENIARCTCNGEILEEGLKLPSSGRIGLEADFGQMEYRNILIEN